MPKNRDDQVNKGGGEDFSLEEILAEYESRREKGVDDDTIPLPVIPQKDLPPEQRAKRRPGNAHNVVSFPGGDGPEDDVPEDKPAPPPKPRPTAKKVLDFPAGEPGTPPQAPPEKKAEKHTPIPAEDVPEDGEEAESPLMQGINRLRQKADHYAEHMFEEEGLENDESIRRAEKYLPGVDVEDDEVLFRERRPRRSLPPAPDLPPQELYRRYNRGLKFLRFRAILVFLLTLPILYVTLSPFFALPLPGLLGSSFEIQVYTLCGMLGAAVVIGIDTVLAGFLRVFKAGLGMDTLVSLSCAATLADALTILPLGGREGQMPYCAVSCLALSLSMWGNYLKRRGQRSACRAAASASEPYLVTLDEETWNGTDAYAKHSGESAGFGSQIQALDGAQRIFRVTAPLLLIACVLFALIASVGQKKPEQILWCLSATLTAAASLSACLAFGMPWNTLSQRLSGGGAALAGWDGVVGTTGGAGILLTDTDLFPPGSVAMNGIKIFGDFSVEKVVACAATLIRDSGSGLDKVFHDLLRAQGAVYRRCDEFECREGGLAATIRGERVYVGSAGFMHLLEVPLPQGVNVKNAVFCAIDGELAGVFALNYSLHGTVRPAITALIRAGVSPILATRDFTIVPAMLRQRFKLPVDKMEFPNVERRIELSDSEQMHSEVLSAVLCREGLGAFAEAVVGGRRLRIAVRANAVIASIGSAVGALLAFYLTFVGAYTSLSPANLLLFMLAWLVPTFLISGWVNRY